MRARLASFGDFRCGHCQGLVSSAQFLSGVNNRNHCPYCLWSCHLDLFAAGDRLAACKAPMKPIGLTLKRSRNKYQPGADGELMLVHECSDCLTLSINRLAADDDAAAVVAVFETSLTPDREADRPCREAGIVLLKAGDRGIVHTRLYGRSVGVPAWSRAG